MACMVAYAVVGPDEAEALLAQVVGQGFGLHRRPRQPFQRGRRLVLGRFVPPHRGGQRGSGLPEAQGGSGVVDGSHDLAPVAHDRRVRQEAVHVSVAERRHLGGVEGRERLPEACPLAEDRQPGQATLETLQAQHLVDAAVVPDRPAPLVVVILLVFRRRCPPGAPGQAVAAEHQFAHPAPLLRPAWRAADRGSIGVLAAGVPRRAASGGAGATVVGDRVMFESVEALPVSGEGGI